MDVRLIFCLIWALLATPNAGWSWPSSCYQSVPGKSSVARSCNWNENSCLTVQEVNTLGGVVNTGILQACSNNNNMQIQVDNLDFEFGEGVYVRVHSEMCRETNCNTGEIRERSKISTVPNGGHCPSCFAPGSHRCLHNVTLHCQGAANQCVDVVGTLSENGIEIPFAARGCATQDVAKIKAGDVLLSGVFTYRIKSIQLRPATQMETMDGF